MLSSVGDAHRSCTCLHARFFSTSQVKYILLELCLIKSPILLKLALTKVLPFPRCNYKDFQEVTFKVLIMLFFNSFICCNYCTNSKIVVGTTHMQEDFRSIHKGLVQGFSGTLELQGNSHPYGFFFPLFLNSSCKKKLVEELLLA